MSGSESGLHDVVEMEHLGKPHPPFDEAPNESKWEQLIRRSINYNVSTVRYGFNDSSPVEREKHCQGENVSSHLPLVGSIREDPRVCRFQDRY